MHQDPTREDVRVISEVSLLKLGKMYELLGLYELLKKVSLFALACLCRANCYGYNVRNLVTMVSMLRMLAFRTRSNFFC